MMRQSAPNYVPFCSSSSSEISKFSLAESVVRVCEPPIPTFKHPYQDYEDHGLRGKSLGSDVNIVTQKLVASLESNVFLEELTLNIQAISESLESSGPIARFLNQSKSLQRLHIRIPPQTKATNLFSRRVICQNLKELTIWVASDRSAKRQIDFMRKSVNNNKRRRLRRCHEAIHRSQCSTVMDSACLQKAIHDDDQFDLQGIARFIASQPQLKYVRVQTSTLSAKQWADLIDGINQNRSLKHVELRRLESNSREIFFSLQKLQHHPTLERIDLNGCPRICNWHSLVLKEANFEHLSWSSSPVSIDSLQQLSSQLSCPASSLLKLEISHTNLSGDKISMISAMLKENCSLRELDLSRTQLNSVDGCVLTKSLQSNSTIENLILNDNSLLKWPCDLSFVGFRDLLSAPTCNLKYLDLSNNDMDPMKNDTRCAKLFEGMARSKKLKVLKLANRGTAFFETLYHKFWNESEKHHIHVSKSLGKALQTCQLTELNLNHNYLDDRTIAKYLAPALGQDCQLVRLSLKQVGMGNKGMTAISKSLMHNQTLEYIDVSNNTGISVAAFRVFSVCLATLSNLHTLWFHANNHDDLHARALAPALTNQCNLQRMSKEDRLPEKYRILIAANRNGRRYLYTASTISDGLWPVILARVSYDSRLLSLFVRERAESFTHR